MGYLDQPFELPVMSLNDPSVQAGLMDQTLFAIPDVSALELNPDLFVPPPSD
jgi:hypothetical protein